MDMITLLKTAMEKGASDLHITVDSAPILRVDGELTLLDVNSLTSDETKFLVYSILSDDQKAIFEKDKELDFSFSVSGLDRFRVNIHYQKGNVEAALRRIPQTIPSLSDLGIPSILRELIRKPNGLILVTGPTGTGKSTTLAALLDAINAERSEIIICIEDPIEFYHTNKKSIIK